MQSESLDTKAHPSVLLAEDDPDQSDMLRDALLDAGYRVDCAFSGDVAYRKLMEHEYNLVLMDVRMPGLNGGTVLKAFRQHKPDLHTPVIIVSAFATGPEMARYKKDGADASFSKPYAVDELLATITVLLQKTRGA
jgi:two-component system copper resistance phosphate regulon response regulator CusR